MSDWLTYEDGAPVIATHVFLVANLAVPSDDLVRIKPDDVKDFVLLPPVTIAVAGVNPFTIESTDGNFVQLRLKSDLASNRRILGIDGSGLRQSQMNLGDDGEIEFARELISEVTMVIDPAGFLSLSGGLKGQRQVIEPPDPAEGEYVIWLSDGTGSGDTGDLMVKITDGAVTKIITLIDFSAA